jgi:Flp pilus assembly protein TadG
MQFDVKSYHNSESGVAFASRTRLKGVLISPSTSVTYNTTFADNINVSGTYNVPGSTTCTVTITNHGLSNGDRVYLNFTSGTAQDEAYTVANVTTDTFTVTVTSATTNGNVTMYPKILAEFDCSSGTAFYTLIPGEGILAPNGIYVGIPNAAITTTIFYG